MVGKLIAEHGVDSVIHFAGYKNAGESMRAPEKYFENNVVATARLLAAMQGTGVRSIVFSGSCSVYGTPAQLPVTESAPLQPESPYGQSKLMCEQLLRWHGAVHGLRWMSLRYFNASGAASDGAIGEDPSVSLNLVPIVMMATLGLRPPVRVFGSDFPTPDGTCVRDYIHVEDLATAHLDALTYLRGGGASTTLNVGYGHGYSVREVIDSVRRVTGKPITVKEEPRRPGDPPALVARADRIRRELGWQPKLDDLDTIVRTAYAWEQRLQRDPW